MDDLDLRRRFQAADPAHSRVIAPLTPRALFDLDSITAGTFVPRLRRVARRRTRARRFSVLAAAAVVLVLAVVVVRTVTPTAGNPESAYAATPPLLAASGPAVPLSSVIDASIRRLPSSGLPSTPLRQSHYEAWFANIDFGTSADVATSAVVSPEEDTFTWAPDLSGSIRSVVGRSWEPTHNGFEGGEIAKKPGTVLRDEKFKPGEVGVAFPQPPPTDVAGMRQRLIDAGWSDTSNPAMLVSTVNELLDEWTLTASQQSALLGVLGELRGFIPLGSVTDRLGRAGFAFRAPDPSNASSEEILVISKSTGAIVSIENIYLGGNPQFAKVLKAPAVLGYTAWK